MIQWLDHTADVQLEITSSKYEDIFSEFVKGLRQLLVMGKIKPAKKEIINLTEDNSALLLIALGREVLLRFNAHRFVPAHFVVSACSPQQLRGTLWGESFNPARQIFQCEVKGITYHNLEVTREAGKWHAVITFDV